MKLILPEETSSHSINKTEAPKTTVGAEAVKLMEKGDQKQSVIETTQEMNKNYMDSLIEAVQRGENLYGKTDIFYIVVLSKKERLLTNVVRRYFFPRKTRPIPDYDTALYHYDPKDEKLTFVWVIPDKDKFWSYFVPGENGNMPSPPEEEIELYKFCKMAMEGRLV